VISSDPVNWWSRPRGFAHALARLLTSSSPGTAQLATAALAYRAKAPYVVGSRPPEREIDFDGQLINVVLDRGSFGGADDFDQVSVLCVDPVLRSLAARSSATGFVCRDTRPTSTSSFARCDAGTSADSHWRCRTRSSTRAANFRLVLVETVGVGQMEVEIASAADTTIVVVIPAGATHAGQQGWLLEVADIFVITSRSPGSVRRDAT